MTDTITTDGGSEDTKKPLKEVPVVQDNGFFTHDTGDTYDGYFEAKKKDRTCKMHGEGIYTTAEGDTYKGVWESDKLGGSEEVVITFVDGSRYEGDFKEWTYCGNGKYFYPDGSALQSEFFDNCPIGNLKLTDPNDHDWLGRAELGYCWLEPVNHYYELLESKDHHKKRRRHLADANTASKTSKLSKLSKTSKQSKTSKMSKTSKAKLKN